MKRILLFVGLSFFVTTISAQNLDAGKRHFYYQKYRSSENFFHEILKQDPAVAEAWLWLTKSYSSQNKVQAAIDSLALAPASLANDPYLLIAKGSIYLERQH